MVYYMLAEMEHLVVVEMGVLEVVEIPELVNLVL
jgi:hypothetical protein